MPDRVKLDNTLPTFDQDNFTHVTAWCRNRTLATVVTGKCTTSLPPAPRITTESLLSSSGHFVNLSVTEKIPRTLRQRSCETMGMFKTMYSTGVGRRLKYSWDNKLFTPFVLNENFFCENTFQQTLL